ncbi:globin domain-containing protein [Streptomyces sp. GC420]|uniref:globin domain-containing protein n=1 Tax=Streptomyces sp. GC420 TaxID=2697568 RepID=UPI0014151590|nr:globin domain-containing protein [Streptomyces sp. GC420]NBM15154.1 flavohemoprotein [Streptomyces sp. GC420]
MSTMGSDYHALLARHEAMKLRQRLMSGQGAAENRFEARQDTHSWAQGVRAQPHGRVKGPHHGPGDAGGAPRAPYDGAADQRVITETLHLVTPFSDLIADLYEFLFDQHPYLRSLFPESMAFQQSHLAQIFDFLIENLDRPDEIVARFGQLGGDHRKLGVRPVHYEAFEEALREALRRRAGAGWAAAAEAAWLRMLRFGVGCMVEGAESALAEPPAWQATVTDHQLRGPDLAVLRVQPHESYPYRAGQYASLESPLLQHTWRPYHCAKAPGRDNELEFHVRLSGSGGSVSRALVHGTRSGDVLRLGPARGALTMDGEGPAGDLLLVASGTGWAPMKALLEEAEGRRDRGGMVRLVLGARSVEELYDADYVTAAERRWPWLKVVPAVGPDQAAVVAEAIRVNGATGTLVHRDGEYGFGAPAGLGGRGGFAAGGGAGPGRLAFVSGPPEVVRAAVDALIGAGVPAGRIRHEVQGAGAAVTR